ncbi:MAG: DNA topoisomerase (ATP-hydrolyzing) subunit A [Candidatus Paceibacterota bacterium]
MSKRSKKNEDFGSVEAVKDEVKDPDNLAIEQILPTNVADELKNSFLEYSMSVIVSRALPDVRDGLKPVQRRILYSMHESGMLPSKGYHKCARVVGSVMGALHPHGDSAIYEALVRMAQNFSLRLPLVDGHGNFGSLDDGPAASRYTECRLDKAATHLVGELDEDTVNFKPNYDARETEPTVLPAAFPNLLVNGTTGIAVGMATNMAPHNLGEVTNALTALLDNPKLSDKELFTLIPAPDLPTGGVIITGSGVREAYLTGRGSFKIRAKTEIKENGLKKSSIIVTELPYMVGPEKVIARIKELISEKRLLGISDVKDYTDRKTGLRLVIDCKAGYNTESILDDLFKLTPLEESFTINNVALVDNQPQTLSLRELCMLYLKHRVEVTRRRSEYRKRKAENREHILSGLLVALTDIDKVVSIIKKSKDSSQARERLCQELSITDLQAESILEMTLRRLTSLEIENIKTELKSLEKQITQLKKILSSENEIKKVVKAEIVEISKDLANPRRSQIVEQVESTKSSAAPSQDCKVILTLGNNIYRSTETGIKKPSKNQIGQAVLNANTANNLYFITSHGRSHKVLTYLLPEKQSKVSDVIDLAKGEEVVALVHDLEDVILCTKKGVLKKIDSKLLDTRNSVMQIIKLKEDDLLAGSTNIKNSAFLVILTKQGQLLKTEENGVSRQGLSAAGVAGLKIKEGDEVLLLDAVEGDNSLLFTLTDKGNYKVSQMSQYPEKGRSTSGLRAHTFKKEDKEIVSAVVSSEGFALTESGSVVGIPNLNMKRDSAGIKHKDNIKAFGKIL